ncbi:hypothetical protein YC2023_114120 [Brassica napus]
MWRDRVKAWNSQRQRDVVSSHSHVGTVGVYLCFLLIDIALLDILGRAFVMLCGECRVIDFGAPGASLTGILSKCSPLLLPFPFQVQLMLVGFGQRRHGILKTHCFGLVAGDKCYDIADHFSYAGSGCHKKIE